MLCPGRWSSPIFTGTRPPPCSAFSLTSIDHHRAILYGGWDDDGQNILGDLYLIDLQTMVCKLMFLAPFHYYNVMYKGEKGA